MKKIVLLLAVWVSIPTVCLAKGVFLMIGDGMGYNHIACTGRNYELFLQKTEPVSSIITSSADDETTDSAAAATAYACGLKTNNSYIGMKPNNDFCVPLAEEAIGNGKAAYIISSDTLDGATPSAFYAHVDNRYKSKEITEFYLKAKNTMYIDVDVKSVYEATKELLALLEKEEKDYFVMIEGAKIDKKSHSNEYSEMEKELVDFDKAVQAVYEYAEGKDDVAVFVTADHETGALTGNCEYKSSGHTPMYVPLYTNLKDMEFKETEDNTVVYKVIHSILFEHD